MIELNKLLESQDYENIYDYIANETDDFRKASGTINITTGASMEEAKRILSKCYNNIEDENITLDDDNSFYTVSYSDPIQLQESFFNDDRFLNKDDYINLNEARGWLTDESVPIYGGLGYDVFVDPNSRNELTPVKVRFYGPNSDNRLVKESYDKIKLLKETNSITNIPAIIYASKLFVYYWCALDLKWDLLADCIRQVVTKNDKKTTLNHVGQFDILTIMHAIEDAEKEHKDFFELTVAQLTELQKQELQQTKKKAEAQKFVNSIFADILGI